MVPFGETTRCDGLAAVTGDILARLCASNDRLTFTDSRLTPMEGMHTARQPVASSPDQSELAGTPHFGAAESLGGSRPFCSLGVGAHDASLLAGPIPAMQSLY